MDPAHALHPSERSRAIDRPNGLRLGPVLDRGLSVFARNLGAFALPSLLVGASFWMLESTLRASGLTAPSESWYWPLEISSRLLSATAFVAIALVTRAIYTRQRVSAGSVLEGLDERWAVVGPAIGAVAVIGAGASRFAIEAWQSFTSPLIAAHPYPGIWLALSASLVFGVIGELIQVGCACALCAAALGREDLAGSAADAFSIVFGRGRLWRSVGLAAGAYLLAALPQVAAPRVMDLLAIPSRVQDALMIVFFATISGWLYVSFAVYSIEATAADRGGSDGRSEAERATYLNSG